MLNFIVNSNLPEKLQGDTRVQEEALKAYAYVTKFHNFKAFLQLVIDTL